MDTKKSNLLRFLKNRIIENNNKIRDNKLAKEKGSDEPHKFLFHPTSNILEQVMAYNKIKDKNYEDFVLIKETINYSIYMVSMFNNNSDNSDDCDDSMIYYIFPVLKNKNNYLPRIFNPEFYDLNSYLNFI